MHTEGACTQRAHARRGRLRTQPRRSRVVQRERIMHTNRAVEEVPLELVRVVIGQTGRGGADSSSEKNHQHQTSRHRALWPAGRPATQQIDGGAELAEPETPENLCLEIGPPRGTAPPNQLGRARGPRFTPLHRDFQQGRMRTITYILLYPPSLTSWVSLSSSARPRAPSPPRRSASPRPSSTRIGSSAGRSS